MKLPLEGGCLCGAVRYRIGAEPDHAGYCHCRMCQRAAGAPVVAWLTVARAAFAWTRGEPAVYRSSAKAERLFCGACGTQLAFREIAEPRTWKSRSPASMTPRASARAITSGPRAGSPGSTR